MLTRLNTHILHHLSQICSSRFGYRCVLRGSIFSLCIGVCGLSFGQQSEELDDIQAKIQQTQAQIDKNKAAAQALEQTLKQAELAISQTSRALAKTQDELVGNRQQQETLLDRQKALQAGIRQQQGQLAAQIKSAYLTGNYDYAKMLLNQEDAAKFERIVSYYQYVSEARRATIETFRTSVKELESVNRQLESKITQLNGLLLEQQQQTQQLNSQQNQRQVTLSKLNNTIRSDAQRVEQLQASADALLRALEQAREAAQQKPTELDGLAKSKGKLQMPAEGRFRRLFGDRRQGQVRWTGVIIEGNEGSAINAVYQGRVLYADWLKGFGLVTILDHGDGFMSVYGHSQALLTQLGDTVSAGQTIGLVGRSGGQASPNLYFEIRHKGKALNPSAWLKWR